MSDFNDRPQFQPPQFQPPASPQGQPFGAPQAGPPTMPPTEPTAPIEVASSAPKKKRSKGIIIGAAVAVVALVGAGVFALTQIGGNDDKGGAASPTEAGENLVAALNDEDILGAVDLLLPGERDTFRQPMIDLVDNLKRLDVLGDDADPSKVKGIDIDLADAKVTADTPAAPDITTITISATDRSTVDGEALPLGDIIIDEALGGERPSDTTEPSDSNGTVALTTVEKDGRWYVSMFYSVAERAREDAGGDPVPETGIPLAGADEPEGAVDQMLKAFTTLDLTTIIGGLNPNEAEALQRYAPLFLDDANQQADDLGVEISLTDATYDVTGSGSSRHVTISGFTLSIAADDQTASIAVADGCAVVTTPDDTFDTCKDGGDVTKTLDDAGFGDDLTPEVEKLITTVQDAFDGFEPTGIAVDEVDGKWYVSPIATGFDLFNGVLGALDNQELQDIIDAAKNADLGDVLGRNAPPVLSSIPSLDTVPDTIDTVPDTVDTTTEDTVGETFPPVSGAAVTVDDFKFETEDFIESQKVADQAGFALNDAECEAPTSTAVGTHYTCVAWDDSGAKFVLDVAITEVDSFSIESLVPA